MKTFSLGAALLFLVGCSEGSLLLVGKARDPITPEQVVIYAQPPEHYEVLAIVTAAGKNAVTRQNKQDFAIKELKAQAASVGANGVLLEQIGVTTASTYAQTSPTSGSYSGGSGTVVEMQGKAIYVSPK